MPPNYYLNSSYRKLTLRWHPKNCQEDKNTANYHFNMISEAYEVLSDRKQNRENNYTYSTTINLNPSASQQGIPTLAERPHLFDRSFAVWDLSRCNSIFSLILLRSRWLVRETHGETQNKLSISIYFAAARPTHADSSLLLRPHRYYNLSNSLPLAAIKRAFYDNYGEERLKSGFFSIGGTILRYAILEGEKNGSDRRRRSGCRKENPWRCRLFRQPSQ